MSDPTDQFDYQAQPFWDEEGNYFPPGFDPRTGEWTDPAFADAYAQGFVWDAAAQQWAPAPAQAAGGDDAGLQASELFGEFSPGSASGEPEGMDSPGAAAAGQLEDAVYRSLKEELGAQDSGALADQAAQAAADIRALLDAVAKGGGETTALTTAVTDALASEVTALIRAEAPVEPENMKTVLAAEPDEAVLLAEQAAAGADMTAEQAPPALYFVQDEALEPLATGRHLLDDPEIWCLAALMGLNAEDADASGAEEDAGDLPYLPASLGSDAGEIEAAEAPQGLRLKNGLPLPLNFDGEEAAPGTAQLMDDDSSLPSTTSLQSLIRADNVLRAVEPQYLDTADIYLPLDDPRPETLLLDGCRVGPSGRPDPSFRQPSAPGAEQTSGLPTIQLQRFSTANPFRTGGPGSDPPAQRRSDSAPPKDQTSDAASPLPSEFQMPSVRVRLKKTKPDGTAASPQKRRFGTNGAFIDVVTPVDLPSDDIELALTSACRRQSQPPHAAEEAHSEKLPGKKTSSLPPIMPAQPAAPRLRSIPPLPGANFFGRPASELVKPIPSRQQLSQKPSAAPAAASKPIKLSGAYSVLCRMMNGKNSYTGRLRNPTLTAPTITLELSPNAQKIELETGKIQAFFFQRANSDTTRPSGRKARLIFHGGTQRTGFLPLYEPQCIGFFFFPTEMDQSRFGFWFVYRHAVASIDFIDD